MYRVQRESGDSTAKTIHRTMLLPFSAIPSSLDLGLFVDSAHSKTSKPAAPVQKSQNLCKNLTLLNQKQKNYFTKGICFLLKKKYISNIKGSKSFLQIKKSLMCQSMVILLTVQVVLTELIVQLF